MFALSIALPGLDKDSAKEMQDLLDEFKSASTVETVRGGVISEGDAAAYALVWEWGNARQTKEGPRTVLGINPDGETVWLSTQAPFGYIRIHSDEMDAILTQALSEINFDKAETADDFLEEIKAASMVASDKIAELIRSVAPIDSGALRESIVPADPDDPDLAAEDEEIDLNTPAFTHAVRNMLKKLK